MPIPREVPFEKWGEKEATEGIKVVPEYAANKLFVEGDHWQGGVGWVGPRPGVDEDGAPEVMAKIAETFTSRNVIGEVVDRHTRGVVGAEPIWGLTLKRPLAEDEEMTPAEADLIDEAEALLTTWWDGRGIARVFQEWVARMLWAQRSVLRLFIPSGLVQEDGSIKATDLADAIDHLYLGSPDPKTAAVMIDPATQQEVGVFQYEIDGKKIVEMSFRAAQTSGPGKNTGGAINAKGGSVVLRILGGTEEQRYVFQLGGRLLMFQGERPLMITQQVQQNQKALNLAMSMLPRNVVTGGFLERVILNGMMPGHYEENPDGGEPIFVPAKFKTGAGTTQWIVGVEDEDEATGAKTTLSPDVKWRDPISVDSSISAVDKHYTSILDETDQSHVQLNSDAAPSGRSRTIARADYVGSLARTQTEVERGGRWLLETTLAMVEGIANKPGRFTEHLRAVVTCQLDEGPLSPEERKQNIDEAKAGYLSKARAMSRNGIADPDAEMAAIATQEDRELDLRKGQAEVVELLTKSGAGLEEAAIAAGMDEETAKLLGDSFVPEEDDVPGDAPPIDEPPTTEGDS